jgi:hypothetical protein
MGHREHFHARGGQLDRQRNAIQPAADLRDDRCRIFGKREATVGGRSAIDKERGRTVLQRLVQLQTGSGLRDGKRWNAMPRFAVDV